MLNQVSSVVPNLLQGLGFGSGFGQLFRSVLNQNLSAELRMAAALNPDLSWRFSAWTRWSSELVHPALIGALTAAEQASLLPRGT